MQTTDPFYLSKRWRRRRELILRRDGYLCQVAKRYGKTVPAEVVHHIFPRKEFPEYALEAWNLLSVSSAAHNQLEDRENESLTEAGKELLRRTARKNGIEIPRKYRE